MRRLAPALLALVLLAGCGSSKHTAPRYDPAKVTRCLRAGADSFARAPGGVVRLNVSGESRFATLAEIDVAFGKTSREALARLRLHYFFRTNRKAKPFVYGRYVGNIPNSGEGRAWFAVWYEKIYAKRDSRWMYLSHRTVHGATFTCG